MGNELSKIPTTKGGPPTLGIDAQLSRWFAFLFQPLPATIEQPRVRTWKTAHPKDGAPCMGKLAVFGTFNGDDDLRTLLTLFKLHNDAQADHEGCTTFAFQEAARLSHRGWRGRNAKAASTADQLATSLLRLRGVLFMPHNVYTDDDGHRVEIGEAITLLDKLTLGRRIKPADGIGPEQTDKLVSRFRFNTFIRRELERNPLKPIVFDTAMSLPRTHPYALRAYILFDRKLIKHHRYTWDAPDLFDELGVTFADRHPSTYKRALRSLVRLFNGKPISTGILTLSTDTSPTGTPRLILTRVARLHRGKQLSLSLHPSPAAPERAPEEQAALNQTLDAVREQFPDLFGRRPVDTAPVDIEERRRQLRAQAEQLRTEEAVEIIAHSAGHPPETISQIITQIREAPPPPEAPTPPTSEAGDTTLEPVTNSVTAPTIQEEPTTTDPTPSVFTPPAAPKEAL